MLGVYFGLVLSGATPNVVAQAPVARHSDNKNSFDKAREEKSLETFAAALEDLYRATSEISEKRGNNGKFSFDYFVTVTPNGASRQYSPTGGASWSRKFLEPLHSLYDAFLPRAEEFNENFLVQFIVGDDHVTLRTTIITEPGSAASTRSGIEQALLRQRSTEANFVRSQIYNASNVTVEKDKIIVVANLPRAGLESILTKSDQ